MVPKRYIHPELPNVTLFGNRDFVDAIKCSRGRIRLVWGWAWGHMEERRPRDGRGRGWRDAEDSQMLGEAGKNYLETSEGAWPCGHLDLGLLSSRTAGKKCLLFKTARFLVDLLWQPWKLKEDRGQETCLMHSLSRQS